MAKAKVQMKEILSQFIDVLIEEELEALRGELTKFRSEIQGELSVFKKSMATSLEDIKKSTGKDILKLKESVTALKGEVSSIKSTQSKRIEEESKKLMMTLEERESIMESNLETLATQVGDTIGEHQDEQDLAIKELSKRVESAEKISLLLNNFASNLSSVATPAPSAYEKVEPPKKKAKKAAPVQEKVAPKVAPAPAPVKQAAPAPVKQAAPAPELVVEDAFLDEKLIMELDNAQILPPLTEDIKGHKVNPIVVDEISGQQLYKP